MIGNEYYGLKIKKRYFAINIFPFSFEILLYDGLQIWFTILDTNINFGLSYDIAKRWD